MPVSDANLQYQRQHLDQFWVVLKNFENALTLFRKPHLRLL